MKPQILQKLHNAETQHNVKILFACESGSRAWGFESADSDYDVRFIYVRPKEWYLSLEEHRDVLEIELNEVMDINGWDLRKTLRLFHSSNPSIFEWIMSPIVYIDEGGLRDSLLELSKEYFNKRSALNHYINMAKNNFESYLAGDVVKSKKYFYVLRPIFAALWIIKNDSNPPIVFEKLMDATLKDENIRDIILNLLVQKKLGGEKNLVPRIEELNSFILDQLSYIDDITKQVTKIDTQYQKLDELFLKYI